MHRARRIATPVLLAALAAAPAAVNAQVLFQEDFQTYVHPNSGAAVLRCGSLASSGGPGTYPFPAGWLLRNVDNRTPDAGVGYVNEAWEVREDFIFDLSDCAAFSTSWYSPVGAADDWMWTPLIGPLPAGNTVLSWNAVTADPSYRDGYEVRVMIAAAGPPTGATGVLGNQVANSTVVFSIAEENTTWTARSVNLAAYAGQSVYIGFRNTSNNKFLLVIDDIVVQSVYDTDPALTSVVDTPTRAYSRLPAPLAYAFDLQAEVRNEGLQPLSNVVVAADLLVDGAPHASLTSAPVANLAPGATQTVTVGSSAFDQPGTWSVEALVTATEGDERTDNSALAVALTEVTADELSRAEGASSGTLGIGDGSGGELGTDFTLPVSAKLFGARLAITNVDIEPPGDPPGSNDGDGVGDFNGYTLEARLRGWNPVADEPGDALATATVSIAPDAALGPRTLEFDFGGIVLPPGRYLLALVEPTLPAPRRLTLHTMLQRYTPGTAWTRAGLTAGAWANVEDFGVQFRRAFDITLVLGAPLTVPAAADDAYSVPQIGTFAGDVSLNDTPSDDGGNVWSLTAPPASGLLALQPDGRFDYTPDPAAAGTTVTFGYSLCDAQNECSTATASLQIQINLPAAADDAISVPQTGTFAGDVSLNDTPSDDGGNVWSVTAPPASGLLVLQPDGRFDYTPDPDAAGTTVTFAYTLCDAQADCSAATASLQIQINQPAAADDAFSVPQTGTFAGNVSLNDTPSDDGGNVWSVTAPPASGLLVLQPDGRFDYTPDPDAAGTTVTFAYTLCDAQDDCSAATVSLQIRVTVPIARDDAFTLPPDAAFTDDVSTNDTSSEDGINLWSLAAPPASGVLALEPDGRFTYTPDATGAGGTLTFQYTLCDGDGACDTATAELTVRPRVVFTDGFEAAP